MSLRPKMECLIASLKANGLSPTWVVHGIYWDEIVFFVGDYDWRRVMVSDSQIGNFLCVCRDERSAEAVVLKAEGLIVAWVKKKLDELAQKARPLS